MRKTKKRFVSMLICFVIFAVACIPVYALDETGLRYNQAMSEAMLKNIKVTVSDVTVVPGAVLNADGSPADEADSASWLEAISKMNFKVEANVISMEVFEIVTQEAESAMACNHGSVRITDYGPVQIVSQSDCTSGHGKCYRVVLSQQVVFNCNVCGASFYGYNTWENHIGY